MSVTSSTTATEPNYRIRDFPEKRRVYIIAVPKYHENLFKHIENNHKWFSSSIVDPGRMGKPDKNVVQHWTKKINTEEEFDKLQSIINDLREEKSELFIDQNYYAKPRGVSIKSYIMEFIKSKSIANHYTFSNYYRITVFPFGADINTYPPQIGTDKETGRPIYAPDERQEYLIIPLLIRLKQGKTYEQNKSISYIQKSDGTWDYEVNNINHHHFKRDPEPEGLDERTRQRHRSLGWVDDDDEDENEEEN